MKVAPLNNSQNKTAADQLILILQRAFSEISEKTLRGEKSNEIRI
jgi:hypothetical protein